MTLLLLLLILFVLIEPFNWLKRKQSIEKSRANYNTNTELQVEILNKCAPDFVKQYFTICMNNIEQYTTYLNNIDKDIFSNKYNKYIVDEYYLMWLLSEILKPVPRIDSRRPHADKLDVVTLQAILSELLDGDFVDNLQNTLITFIRKMDLYNHENNIQIPRARYYIFISANINGIIDISSLCFDIAIKEICRKNIKVNQDNKELLLYAVSDYSKQELIKKGFAPDKFARLVRYKIYNIQNIQINFIRSG